MAISLIRKLLFWMYAILFIFMIVGALGDGNWALKGLIPFLIFLVSEFSRFHRYTKVTELIFVSWYLLVIYLFSIATLMAFESGDYLLKLVFLVFATLTHIVVLLYYGKLFALDLWKQFSENSKTNQE